jgi:CDP-glycerol glycerophosphotransferase (TagB/SpsB family)
MSRAISEQIGNNQSVRFLENENITKFLPDVDLLVADMSSLIAEYVALDRPIITFTMGSKKGRRHVSEIEQDLKAISERVETFDQLIEVLPDVINHPEKRSSERKRLASKWLDNPDGRAAERVAANLRSLLDNR